MERFLVALLVTVFVIPVLMSGRCRPMTQRSVALDKAIKALGGEDKLSKLGTATWKAKGKYTTGDNERHDFTGQTTVQGLDHFRWELEVDLQRHDNLLRQADRPTCQGRDQRRAPPAVSTHLAQENVLLIDCSPLRPR